MTQLSRWSALLLIAVVTFPAIGLVAPASADGGTYQLAYSISQLDATFNGVDDEGNVHLGGGSGFNKLDGGGRLLATLDLGPWKKSGNHTLEKHTVGPDGLFYLLFRTHVEGPKGGDNYWWVQKTDYAGQALQRWALQKVAHMTYPLEFWVSSSGEVSMRASFDNAAGLDSVALRFAGDGRLVAQKALLRGVEGTLLDASGQLYAYGVSKSERVVVRYSPDLGTPEAVVRTGASIKWVPLYVDPAGIVYVLYSPGVGQTEHLMSYGPDGALQADLPLPTQTFPGKLIGVDGQKRLYFSRERMAVDVYALR